MVSGDGLIGKVGGALAGSATPLGVIPGGRGNDFARVVGIPTEPAEAVAVLAADQRRRIDVGEANGERFLCIASCGFDSDANRIANEAKLISGRARLRLRGDQGALAVAPGAVHVTVDGERRRADRLLGGRRQLEGLRRRDVRRPRRRARRRPARRRHHRRHPEAPVPRRHPGRLQGRARRARRGRRSGAAGSSRSRRTGPSTSTPTATDHRAAGPDHAFCPTRSS